MSKIDKKVLISIKKKISFVIKLTKLCTFNFYTPHSSIYSDKILPFHQPDSFISPMTCENNLGCTEKTLFSKNFGGLSKNFQDAWEKKSVKVTASCANFSLRHMVIFYKPILAKNGLKVQMGPNFILQICSKRLTFMWLHHTWNYQTPNIIDLFGK